MAVWAAPNYHPGTIIITTFKISPRYKKAWCWSWGCAAGGGGSPVLCYDKEVPGRHTCCSLVLPAAPLSSQYQNVI